MDDSDLYELVADAVQQALDEREGGRDIRLSRRMVAGKVVFIDDQDRTVKEVPAQALFKKVTSVREKLRVLEQKLNNHGGLTEKERGELQGYITRCYGSLTTFNFLFLEAKDSFRGTGG